MELPAEVWGTIFNFLDVQSLGRLAQVCKLLSLLNWPCITLGPRRKSTEHGYDMFTSLFLKRPSTLALGRYGWATTRCLDNIIQCHSLRYIDFGDQPLLTMALATRMRQMFCQPSCRLRGVAIGGSLTQGSAYRNYSDSVEIVQEICEGLRSLPTLDAFTIAEMPLRDGAAAPIARLLCGVARAIKLQLHNCEIHQRSIEVLVNQFTHQHMPLKELSIVETKGIARTIGDSGIALLVDALSVQTSIVKLRLHNVGIKQPQLSISAIANLLELGSLTQIDLEGARLSAASSSRLCSALQTTSCRLQKLTLANCNLTDLTVAPLVKGLCGMHFLTNLDLRGNRLRCSTLRVLSEQIRVGLNHLNTIVLRGNIFGSAGTQAIVDALKLSELPKQIDLRDVHGGYNPNISMLECDRVVQLKLVGFPLVTQGRPSRTRRSVRV